MKDLTQDKCDEYASWLFKKKKLERNSQGRHMKHLKWFIKSIKPHPFDYRDIKVLTHQKEIISLTLDELTSLENLEVPKIINSLKEFERKKGTAKNDIPSESDYQKAKDLFLLGCYTSLRVSDLKRINKNLIFIDMKKGDKEIRLTTKKNKKKLQIPILPETWKILTRYNQRSPKISEPTANKCIKGLCMVAGIESIITWTSTKGNEEKPMESKKYELVTLHVSGKTFISLADEKWGFTPSDVSAMAGKDHRTVERYYKSVNIERAKEKMRAMAVNE